MAKDIKNQLWNEHFNVSIPELQEQQREKQPQLQMVYAKLPSTERNNKFIYGKMLLGISLLNLKQKVGSLFYIKFS